jgi:DNA-binding NtrC family response regulator
MMTADQNDAHWTRNWRSPMSHIVLLVDDDPNLLAGLSRALRRQPYQICTARSGEEALWVLKTRDVDVVVSDQRMPGMLGNQLLAWIAQNRPEVMRIMLTGHAEAETAIEAINTGSVYQFFIKPCNEVQLAVAIRKAIEHKTLLAERRRLLEALQSRLEQCELSSLDQQFRMRAAAEDLQRLIQAIAEAAHALAGQVPRPLPPSAQGRLTDLLEAISRAQRLLAAIDPAQSPQEKQRIASG